MDLRTAPPPADGRPPQLGNGGGNKALIPAQAARLSPYNMEGEKRKGAARCPLCSPNARPQKGLLDTRTVENCQAAPNKASEISSTQDGAAHGPQLPPEVACPLLDRSTETETCEKDSVESRDWRAANVPGRERLIQSRGPVQPETSRRQTDFSPDTIVEQLGLPQQRPDGEQRTDPASETENLSAGVAPGDEREVRRIKIL